MLISKNRSISKSKLYRALEFYNSFDTFIIDESVIVNYIIIEHLTILFAIGYVRREVGGYFVKLY